jgi:UDP-N-acetylmuramate: L-alanyl-gamma-D-glutamyl-meso-diaminopimelate ligase
VFLYQPPYLEWPLDEVAAQLAGRGSVAGSIEELLKALRADLHAGDDVVIMSNGSFGGLHGRLLEALENAA